MADISAPTSQDTGAKCVCRHPMAWHGKHGCYAISSAGACQCKKGVVDLMSALKTALQKVEA